MKVVKDKCNKNNQHFTAKFGQISRTARDQQGKERWKWELYLSKRKKRQALGGSKRIKKITL
jgi:hypothetical protein